MRSLEKYNKLNEYLKEKFGERTLKICIDGGFTCPNRDGTKGIGGCIFCSEKGSGEHIHKLQIASSCYSYSACSPRFSCSCSHDIVKKSIQKQVENYFKSYKAERANKFIVYFQNFTNTYDTIDSLKLKYDSALIDDRIVGLEIATRPDCINEEIVQLLKSYTKKYYVCVELGLQTANEETGNLINRCYSNSDFSNSVSLLNKYGIDVVTHIMVGLPSVNNMHETMEDIINTVQFINKHNIQGIKIHSCYVVKNTRLEELYNKKQYIPLTLGEYLKSCAYIITHIAPSVIVHRVSGDAPKDLLVAPSWNSHKKWILNGLHKLLEEENLEQGMYF